MKNTMHLVRYLTVAVGLAGLIPANAANRTWTGGGDDDFWSTAANWGGTAPTATGDALFFGGTTRPTPDNTTVTSLNGISFLAGAGSFTLSGGGFTLNGNISNASGVLQTIENAMALNANRTVDMGSGEILLSGVISADTAARALIKSGTGTLTLAGANTFLGNVQINLGKVVLDAAAGGSLATGGTGTLFLGGTDGATSNANQGATFEVRGTASGTTTANVGRTLTLGNGSGANRIVVNSNGGDGTTLQFARATRNLSTARGVPTLNIDLSSANSALKLDELGSGFALANGVLPFATVTDSVKTGFATRDTGTGLVTRNTPAASLPDVTGSSATNYSTSGNLTLTGNVAANTVTITGGGDMQGSSHALTTRAILMEEGAGNYTVGAGNVGGTGGLLLHQYSTAGTLVIAGDMNTVGGNYQTYHIAKIGPGAVIFQGDGNNYSGTTDLQEGLFQLDGSLKEMQVVQVRNGATLAGSGGIGGGIQWTWDGSNNVNSGTRHTPVNVWDGGVLDASYVTGDALSITGSLNISSGATYRLTLAESSYDALSVSNTTGGIVNLDGNLELTLAYAPTLNERIDLLTWSGGTQAGAFATINGAVATSIFTLDAYEFEIIYDTDAVYLTVIAVPEPNSAMLIAVAACLIVAFRGRRYIRMRAAVTIPV